MITDSLLVVIKSFRRLDEAVAAAAEATDIRMGDSRLRSSKEMLMTLHWLPVRSCIKYKLAVLTYKALNMGQPMYFINVHIKLNNNNNISRVSVEHAGWTDAE